ncbi:MAG: MmgE/PrpD family protein [Pseudomonadota bacterium]
MAQPTNQTDLTRQLADFVAQTSYDDLPSEVVEQAKLFILDTLGCALGGRIQAKEEVSWVTGFATDQKAAGQSTIFGEATKTNAVTAAMTNGAMVHTIDFDDTHMPSISHLGSSLVATTFALGEELLSTGKEIIEAFVLGFDVAGRIGRCTMPTHYKFWHPTATFGGIGAAAAAAKLVKLDADGIEMTIGLAADAAGGLRYGVDNGDFSKSLHPALAAMKAVLFAQLVKGGATGPRGILEYPSGFFNAFSEEPNPEPLLDRLGENYEISVGGLKSLPTIQCSHTAVAKTLDLVAENGLQTADIAEVSIVQSETMPGQGMNYAPQSPLAARLSTPFAVSLGLKDGAVALERFSEETLADPDINDLLPRIKIEASLELAEKYPNTVAALVDVKTHDGRVFSGEQIYAKGDPNNRMTPEEIAAKFRTLAVGALGVDRVDQLADGILALEATEDLCEVTKPLGAA